ncbi:MAG: MlaD family protein [Treponema sp.]|jgi:phospholipid/cholesterol/gamma-HCH transport system substrate-binding protein|nr:MlaD family protein [Treponema sp.]
MKFTIRYADRLVGVLIVIAVAALGTVIFLLGSSQRWFAKDYHFITYFDSAAGLSKNMAVQYKGFTIGRVKSFDLTPDDRVEVHFNIFDTYISRVRQGSLVDISISPVGLGNQFLFYAGLGSEQIEEGSVIPIASSPEGKDALSRGLAFIPRQDDSISMILSQVNTLLASLDTLTRDLSGAFEGTGDTTLGRTLGNVEELSQGFSEIPDMLRGILGDLAGNVDQIMESAEPILANLRLVSDDLSDPEGTVAQVLDSSGPVYANLTSMLESLSGAMASLEQTAAYVPAQLPQITVMLAELQAVLNSVEDVLTAVLNNPLLRNGVGERVENQSTGAGMRDLAF